jgi:DNA-binding NtrC family response regulator
MADGDILDITDLAQILRPMGADMPLPPLEGGGWPGKLKEAERELILKTLESVQGNRTRAAELLGISLRGLHYKLKEMQAHRAVQ